MDSDLVREQYRGTIRAANVTFWTCLGALSLAGFMTGPRVGLVALGLSSGVLYVLSGFRLQQLARELERAESEAPVTLPQDQPIGVAEPRSRE